jgi:hypothetical protein
LQDIAKLASKFTSQHIESGQKEEEVKEEIDDQANRKKIDAA